MKKKTVLIVLGSFVGAAAAIGCAAYCYKRHREFQDYLDEDEDEYEEEEEDELAEETKEETKEKDQPSKEEEKKEIVFDPETKVLDDESFRKLFSDADVDACDEEEKPKEENGYWAKYDRDVKNALEKLTGKYWTVTENGSIYTRDEFGRKVYETPIYPLTRQAGDVLHISPETTAKEIAVYNKLV